MENNQNIGFRILYFPLTRIILGLLFLSIVISLIQVSLFYSLGEKTFFYGDVSTLIQSVFTAGVVLVAYYYFYRFYEKRTITELQTNSILDDLNKGFIVGFGIMSLTIFVMFLFGSYHILSLNSVNILLSPLAMGISSGVIEEVLFRGVIFRITEEKLGSYLALLISGLIFGFMHIGNPNSSVFAALAIAIEAGILLGVAYMWTRTLWFPIAIHFMWNFSQSAIYGANVSGTSTTKSLVDAQFDGSDWITGGNFGPEASLQAIFFGLVTALILLRFCRNNHSIIEPFWRKKEKRNL